MPTNFKNKIRSADIIYEIYLVTWLSVLSSSLQMFIIIYL